MWRRYVRDSRAVSALEYAILVGLIAVAVGGALVTFGAEITEAITQIGGQIDNPDAAELDLSP